MAENPNDQTPTNNKSAETSADTEEVSAESIDNAPTDTDEDVNSAASTTETSVERAACTSSGADATLATTTSNRSHRFLAIAIVIIVACCLALWAALSWGRVSDEGNDEAAETTTEQQESTTISTEKPSENAGATQQSQTTETPADNQDVNTNNVENGAQAESVEDSSEEEEMIVITTEPSEEQIAEVEPEPIESDTITVYVYIDTHNAYNYDSTKWPSSMGSGYVELTEGATPYDALAKLDVSISGNRYYVSGINGLGEKACGSNSGWLFAVNGYIPYGPGVSAGSYPLSDGDSVTWIYTVEEGDA